MSMSIDYNRYLSNKTDFFKYNLHVFWIKAKNNLTNLFFNQFESTDHESENINVSKFCF